MNSPALPLDVDVLMARIRAEVARRKQTVQGPGLETSDSGAGAPINVFAPITLNPLPLPILPKPQFTPAERFQLNDFLALHDEAFIEAAYRGVLKRGTDVQGRQHYLGALRNGALSKIEILGRLRYSPEGRRSGIPVKGLLPAFAVQHMYRVPIVGGLVALVVAVVHLPRIARNLQGLEGYQHQRNAELESAIRNLALIADGNERQLGLEISQCATGSSELAQRIDTMLAQLNNRIENDNQRVAATLGENQEQLAQLSDFKEQAVQHEADMRDWIETAGQRFVMVESRNEALESRLANTESRNDAQEQRSALSESRHEMQENRIAQLESHKQNIAQQLIDVVAQSQQTSTQLATTLRETLSALEHRVEGMDDVLKSGQDDARNAHLRLIERVARAEGRLHEQGLRLGETVPIANASAATKKVVRTIPVTSRFDKFYFAFEQRFRGSREEIRQRLTYYLPMLRESVVGSEGATVLDVGCGRGEWLELLRDEKLSARGIDRNEKMAQACVERGLKVEIGDAITRLRQLPDNTLGALTGFHIIEHVSLEALLELIEQAHRVVQPGGLVIFETPNPENIAVAACNFYIDPTHQRPLPPVLTQFLVEAGGFVDVAIHRVNAELLPQVFEEPTENDSPALCTALKYLRSVFLCAPDYSVVGRVA